MSKQSDAKDSQRYNPKPVWPTCSNCEEYTFNLDYPAWVRKDIEKNPDREREYKDCKLEVNIRCGLGGFKVAKTATCSDHRFKPE